MIELTAGKDDSGRRLDRILRKALPDLSLSLIHRLLRQKKILIDDKPASPDYRIEQGMIIKIYAPATHISNQVNNTLVNHDYNKVNEKAPGSIRPLLRLKPSRNLRHTGAILGAPALSHKSKNKATPCTLGVSILWQGSGIIVFNKPQGLSTHGPQSLESIVNAWLAGTGSLPHSLSFRPGPLHRLDKPTSGVIAFSQTLEGAQLFSSLIRERKLEKTYIAIVEGCMKGEETWQDALTHNKKTRKSFVNTNSRLPTPNSKLPIPKETLTTVKTLSSNDQYSLIEAKIKTGRHHQIRAQAASHGHPLAGDTKYNATPLPGQTRGGGFFLHAWKIKFNGCLDGLPHEITAPLPEAFQSQIEALFGEDLRQKTQRRASE
jgi:23S rRNA pseudouridine955/2504/2580 synthase